MPLPGCFGKGALHAALLSLEARYVIESCGSSYPLSKVDNGRVRTPFTPLWGISVLDESFLRRLCYLSALIQSLPTDCLTLPLYLLELPLYHIKTGPPLHRTWLLSGIPHIVASKGCATSGRVCHLLAYLTRRAFMLQLEISIAPLK